MDSSQEKTMKCDLCGKEIREDSQFCPYCGNKIERKIQICSCCGKEIGIGMLFCPACGTKVENAVFDDIEMKNYTDSIFIHESDRKALKALKAIPGFTPLLKTFMKVFNEREYRIINMSSKLRLTDQQIPKYYNMLVPVCEKLKIDVPELYLEMNPDPNAYTSGDTMPFITLTSGLIKTFPDDLIQTVIAHECGHIACHHVLYHTMASTLADMIINGVGSISGILGKAISTPLLVALFYWVRCSEFSADRAAAVFNGSSEKSIETCMALAGWDKEITEGADPALFMKQAQDYKDIVANSKWDKAIEILTILKQTHPFTAVRAYEVDNWTKTYDFQKALKQYE